MAAPDSIAPPLASRRPSPGIAAFLSLLLPGVGHLYAGRVARGLALFGLALVLIGLLVLVLRGVLPWFPIMVGLIGALLLLMTFAAIDAMLAARRAVMPAPYGAWLVCLVALVLGWLSCLLPPLFFANTTTSGQAGYVPVYSRSMEPAIRHSEHVLVDTAYYRENQPSRGDVVVYTHPKHPDRQIVKRVAALAGDRIAIRDGRVLINRRWISEPYVDVGDPRSPLNSMQEITVPRGTVFVLGDVRDSSEDSRLVTHGPVPLANLTGRVTDIAFSDRLERLGLRVVSMAGE